MTTDDVISWVEINMAELFIKLAHKMEYDDRLEAIGAYDILNKLRFHILAVTNPHNREDLKC